MELLMLIVLGVVLMVGLCLYFILRIVLDIQKTSLPTHLKVLYSLGIVLAVPMWLFVVQPWYDNHQRAQSHAAAQREDEAARSAFQALCSQLAPVDLQQAQASADPLDIQILEDDFNRGTELKTLARGAARDASACNSESCVAANIGNIDMRDQRLYDCRNGSRGAHCAERFYQDDANGNVKVSAASKASYALVIGKYEPVSAEGGRIKRYPLKVVSLADQKLLATATLYRLETYLHPRTNEFCPPQDELFKGLLAKVFPRAGK